MRLEDSVQLVLVPANRAVCKIQLAGLPVSEERCRKAIKWIDRKLDKLKKFVEGEAAKRGFPLKYSDRNSLYYKDLGDFLYSPRGLGLPVRSVTPKTGAPSTSEAALKEFASISHPRPDDSKVVWAILKIRSLAKAKSTYLIPFLALRRSDGCVHPQYNWAKVRTARISAENPPVHQIPEHSDPQVAKLVKSVLVPRVAPAPDPESWDPRKHGSCFRWDISGAEAAIRMAMLPVIVFGKPDPIAWEYIVTGKDIHAKTAAFLFEKEEGAFSKGTVERDVIGKQCNFLLIYGGSPGILRQTIWTKARVLISEEQAKLYHRRFFRLYPGVAALYEWDKAFLGKYHYCEDGYGRRRWIDLPPTAKYLGVRNGKAEWTVADEEFGKLNHAFHVAANTPTQSMNAMDTLFMLALLSEGEYVELAVPDIWKGQGVLFPEAKNWRLDSVDGLSGKPFLAWHSNTVHDSGWGDCAPGMLEPLAKLIIRRCTAIPFDWRLQANVPYRVDLKVGPDFGHLIDYNIAAKQFGLESIPKL